MPLPHLAVYVASKAYVIASSEALSAELPDTKVRVTCLCPGATNTNFAAVADMNKRPFFRHPMSADLVARQGLKAKLAGRRRIVAGLGNRAVAAAVGFVPRGLVLNTARRLSMR